MGKLWFPKSVNIFVTKAYCLVFEVWGFLCVLGWETSGFGNAPKACIRIETCTQSFPSVDHMHFLQPSLFFMKTFVVINPKAHPVSCRRWEESSHHAQLEHFVTSAACRVVCRKPFSGVWLTDLVYVVGLSLTMAQELERDLLQDLILFFFWGWDLSLSFKSSSSCLLSSSCRLILSNWLP